MYTAYFRGVQITIQELRSALLARNPRSVWTHEKGQEELYFFCSMAANGTSSTCYDCGLPSAEGEPSCSEMRDLLLARDFEQPVLYWQYHRLAVDAYCVQHAAYVQSGKSLAAHLCGLCIAFEGGNEAARRGLQQWLSTNPDLHKPTLPGFRGDLTIHHVHGLSDPVKYGEAVREWARSAWEAYRDLHPTAREWLAQSVGCGDSARRGRNPRTSVRKAAIDYLVLCI